LFSHTFLFYVLHLPVFGSGVPIFFSCTHLFLSLSVTKHKRNTYICIYVNTYIGKYWDTHNMLDQMYAKAIQAKRGTYTPVQVWRQRVGWHVRQYVQIVRLFSSAPSFGETH